MKPEIVATAAGGACRRDAPAAAAVPRSSSSLRVARAGESLFDVDEVLIVGERRGSHDRGQCDEHDGEHRGAQRPERERRSGRRRRRGGVDVTRPALRRRLPRLAWRTLRPARVAVAMIALTAVVGTAALADNRDLVYIERGLTGPRTAQ